MTGELDGLDAWITDIIESLGPRDRRKVLASIGRDLRRNTTRRMAAQVGPDGRKWAARKDGSRRKMFKRLRLAKHLKTKASANHVQIGFNGNAARIARVHHYGLTDRVKERGVKVKYARREMLGLSARDNDDVDAAVTNWISQE